MTKVTQASFKFFDTLPERPLETLSIRHACLETHTPIIRLAQEPLELGHMRAEPLNDGIGGLLQFLFQLLDGFRKIFVRLITALSPMENVPYDKQQDSTEDDECTQNFGNRNNNRTPPLSTSTALIKN